MSIDAIGFVTLAVGLAGLMLGPAFALRALVLSSLLGAASALTIGDPTKGSSVQPAYVLLCFCGLVFLSRDRSRLLLANALRLSQPGFWLVMTVLYGAATAVILPRLFESQAYVYAVVRTEGTLGLALRPLTPVSGNLTQTIYLAGDILAFAIGAACAATRQRLGLLVGALLACTGLNLVLGAVDLAAFKAGLGDVLGFLRNANYRMLQDGEIVGFKRIVGAFPEASSYAYMTLGLFAFCLRLWLGGVRARLTGPLAALALVAMVMTTSTSGYVGLLACLAQTYAYCLTRAMRGRGTRAGMKVLLLVPILGVVALLATALNETAQQVLLQLGEATVLNKMSTQSGVERGAWNTQALEVFRATSGLGAGVGSVRASSFFIALLANVGIIGTALYASFLLSVFRTDGLPTGDAYRAVVQSAARAACFALLASAGVAGGGIDLGLVFCLLAGVGSSRLMASHHSVARHSVVRNAFRQPSAAGVLPHPA